MIGDSGDYYEFDYNEDGQVETVKLNGSVLGNYWYYEDGSLYKIYDALADKFYYYIYNKNSLLQHEYRSDGKETGYKYEYLGELKQKRLTIDNYCKEINFDTSYESSKQGYIKRLSEAFDTEIIIRGDELLFSDTQEKLTKIKDVINTLLNLVKQGKTISKRDVMYTLKLAESNNLEAMDELYKIKIASVEMRIRNTISSAFKKSDKFP